MQAERGVQALAPPAMVIFRAVTDQEQDTRGWETLDQRHIGSEEIADGEIRDRTAVGDAPSLETSHVWPLSGRARAELLTKLGEQPGFPHARLAHETHHLPTPLRHLCPQLVEKRQLACAVDKLAHREAPKR